MQKNMLEKIWKASSLCVESEAVKIHVLFQNIAHEFTLVLYNSKYVKTKI